MTLGDSFFQKVADHNLHYHRTGSGETILLVHGITTYSFIWRKIVPFLKEKFDVITIDLFGCGESDKKLDIEFSVKNHSQFIAEFIQNMGIKKFHFVGHDIGGGIGQRFAVEFQSLLYDLTLINTVAYDFWPVQPIIAMRTPIIRQLAMATLDFGTLKIVVSHGIYNKKMVTNELLDYFWKPMQTKEGRKAFLHFAKSLNNKDLLEIQDKLKQLNIPVLIIRGENDVYLSSEIANKLNREIPNSQLEIIPNAGHFMQEDKPEQIARLLLNFISR